MKRWLVVLAVSLGLLAPAAAFWQSRDSNYNVAISAGVTYQGPGDIVSGAIFFGSCGRAYNAAFASTQGAICKVVDTATGAANCTFNVGTNGFANLTATVCVGNTVSIVTFCTVTHTGCSVTEMFDQTGNGNNVLQATLASMPALSFGALNSLPCGLYNGTSSQLLSSAITQAQPLTLEAVAKRTTVGGGPGIIGSFGGSLVLRGSTSANTVVIASGGTNATETASDNAFHALQGIVPSGGTGQFVVVDGTPGTTANGSTGAFSSNDIIIGSFSSVFYTGTICEAFISPSQFNSTQYGNMNTNIHSASNGWNF